MPLSSQDIGSLIGTASSIGGEVASNGDKTTNRTSTTTPLLDPLHQSLQNTLMQGANANLQDPNLQGYTANGMANINAGANAQQKIMSNTLAARGLSDSPIAAGALGQADQNRINQQTQFQNGIPLLANEVRNQNLNTATRVNATSPYGTNTTSQEVVKGNPLAGLLAGLAKAGTGTGGSSPLGDILRKLGIGAPAAKPPFNGPVPAAPHAGQNTKSPITSPQPTFGTDAHMLTPEQQQIQDFWNQIQNDGNPLDNAAGQGSQQPSDPIGDLFNGGSPLDSIVGVNPYGSTANDGGSGNIPSAPPTFDNSGGGYTPDYGNYGSGGDFGGGF
jgi:hypothetical protein